MGKKKKSAERGRVLLGILINRRNTLERYEKVLRDYLLNKTKWENVEKAKEEALYWGATQDDFNEASRKAHESVTDEELLNAIG